MGSFGPFYGEQIDCGKLWPFLWEQINCGKLALFMVRFKYYICTLTERRMIIIRGRHFQFLISSPSLRVPISSPSLRGARSEEIFQSPRQVRRNLPVPYAALVLPILPCLAGPLKVYDVWPPLRPEKRAQQTRKILGVAAFSSRNFSCTEDEIVGCF